MNKKRLVLIILLVFGILLFYFIINNNDTKNIKRFFISNGYTYDDGIYYKQISDINSDEFNKNVTNKIDSFFELLSFNSYNYNFILNKDEYIEGINTYLTASYDYKTDDITYTYRFTYLDTNVIIDGDYNNYNNFTCQYTFAHNFDKSKVNNEICDSIEYDIKKFDNIVTEIMRNPNLTKYFY